MNYCVEHIVQHHGMTCNGNDKAISMFVCYEI